VGEGYLWRDFTAATSLANVARCVALMRTRAADAVNGVGPPTQATRAWKSVSSGPSFPMMTLQAFVFSGPLTPTVASAGASVVNPHPPPVATSPAGQIATLDPVSPVSPNGAMNTSAPFT
jgi:hypothetical protein